jgi:hypothetical protein
MVEDFMKFYMRVGTTALWGVAVVAASVIVYLSY